MEAELIAELRRRIRPHPLLQIGLGDDAAVLRMAAVNQCAVTTDLLTDGVDFRLDEVDARRVGRKSLAVNLSDLAATAARPLAAVVALALPRRDGLRLALELYEGMLPLAEQYSLAIAGGDTNSWDGPLVISITALGAVTPRGPLRRGGARPGDRILVTGSLGGSILGHHFDFTPRVDEALLLAERYELHAGIDISDGLSIDLGHLVEESGCGSVLDLDAVPVSAAAEELAKQLDDGHSALDHALGDGEDFELILAVEPDEARRIVAEQPLAVPVADVGCFVAESGLWQTDRTHGRRKMIARGWQHKFD
ncbi:MAG: thiamine-monophosphate kinase [Pirellulales bacterium]|nr:thiamine-monophosphate kinase [Pirellulales bacterium]